MADTITIRTDDDEESGLDGADHGEAGYHLGEGGGHSEVGPGLSLGSLAHAPKSALRQRMLQKGRAGFEGPYLQDLPQLGQRTSRSGAFMTRAPSC